MLTSQLPDRMAALSRKGAPTSVKRLQRSNSAFFKPSCEWLGALSSAGKEKKSSAQRMRSTGGPSTSFYIYPKEREANPDEQARYHDEQIHGRKLTERGQRKVHSRSGRDALAVEDGNEYPSC